MAMNRDPAQIAQNFMDRFAQGRLDTMKSDQDRRTALLDSLLSIEMEQLNRDRDFLRQEGINLPDADTTEAFNTILALTGNAELDTTLQLMLNTSREKGDVLDEAIAEYHKGRKLSERALTEGRAETAGELGRDKFLFSPEERESVFEDPDYIQQNLVASVTDEEGNITYSEAFLSGFDKGAGTIDEAVKRLSEDQLIQTQQINLNQGLLNEARQINSRLASSIGSTIVANMMSKSGMPILMYKGAMGGDGNLRETFSDALESMNSDKNWIPNIKADLITAINLYADPTSQIDNHMGFVRMAGNAYGLMIKNSSMEEVLITRGSAVDSSQASSLLLDSTSDFYSQEYVDNMIILEEYASIGVMPSDITVAEKAYVTMQQYNNIEIGEMNVAHQTSAQLANVTGLGYDEIDESLIKLERGDFETRISKWEDIESTYNDFFPEGGAGGTSDSVEELGLGLTVGIDTDIEELAALGAESKVQLHNVRSLTSGGNIWEYSKGRAIKIKDDVISKDESLGGLSLEMNAFSGPAATIYDGLEGFREHEMHGGSFWNYIPTPDEIDIIKGKMQRWVNDQLAVGSRSREGYAGGLSTLFGSLPGTSMIVEGLDLYPTKSALEVAGNVEDVRQAVRIWNNYATTWNKIRGFQGKQKITLGQLTERVSTVK